jgi:hypothetical protein
LYSNVSATMPRFFDVSVCWNYLRVEVITQIFLI